MTLSLVAIIAITGVSTSRNLRWEDVAIEQDGEHSIKESSPATDGYLGKNSFGLDIFEIDLDSPPEVRFAQVAGVYKEHVQATFTQYIGIIPSYLQFLIKPAANLIWVMHSQDYYKEVTGMSTAIGIDAHTLMLFQYVYDLSAFCTSVIAYDNQGTLIHSRNLDFLFSPPMRNITYEAKFVKADEHGNKVEAYRAIMFAGLNGIFTGHKAGFSISLNERKPTYRKNFGELAINIGTFILFHINPSMQMR